VVALHFTKVPISNKSNKRKDNVVADQYLALQYAMFLVLLDSSNFKHLIVAATLPIVFCQQNTREENTNKSKHKCKRWPKYSI
jgi:hypothetical protein